LIARDGVLTRTQRVDILSKKTRRVAMKNWISAKGKRGMYKHELRIRVPREIRRLVEQRARQRSMNLAEYIRFLIHKDLEKEGTYGEK